MHSHRSTVALGFGKYIQHIEPEQCLKVHRFRQLDLKGMGTGVISKLILNETTEVLATLQGFADANGRCEEEICAQKAWLTEQNHLLVIFEDSVGFYYHHTIRISQNTDMMAQILSKLLYLEIAVKRQMANVIYHLIMEICHLREKILQNRLAMAKQSPEPLVIWSKKHQDIAVVVDYRKTSECYQELPVIYLNRSLYKTAITHILVEHGTKVECQPLLPVNFKLENNWFKVTPDLKRTIEALELDANDEEDKLLMPSISISPISSNGIYSKEDMESFQQTLLYPNIRKAVTNQVARRIIALDNSDPYYVPNLFSETEFTNI
ncbi:unnamed protein product [Ceutorhynchus assimilis]|uniref:Uncharacterized protein n=1 Tax=Ceutorhynchus assimilis TaxID=467358 RepID=A0A9N9Q9Q6_9CUCU|nr:unnamed protein product [Ceutorhynchus assimilis]